MYRLVRDCNRLRQGDNIKLLRYGCLYSIYLGVDTSMIIYEVRKEFSRDNGETLDMPFRVYGIKAVADLRAAKMNEYGKGNAVYTVREVVYDNSPS
jgi:hypothetical protein